MNDVRDEDADVFDSVHRFIVAGAGDGLTDDQWTDFERLLREDSDAKRVYVKYVSMLVLLPSVLTSVADDESSIVDPLVSKNRQNTLHVSSFGWLGGTINTTAGYFSSGWPVAYLVATVILGLGLLIGGLVHVSSPLQVVRHVDSVRTSNPQSLIPNPSLSTTHHPLFTVRTPTAVVTDLGTEFGVEVREGQASRVCVLQGSVSLVSSLNNASERILERGQSASIDAQGTVAAQSDAETVDFVRSFVRRLPGRSHPISVSLTDLVAGGDGFGKRSCWGINPLDASVVMGAQPAPNQYMQSTGQYQRYSGSPCIDGVFIPDGSNGPVQLDSAGHAFALPKTSGKTVNWSIWGYRGMEWEAPHRDQPSIKAEATLSSMLFLPTNVGITFDLAAIRTAATSRQPIRFVTTARNCPWTANAPFESTVDVWVFVDGQLCFNRLKLSAKDGSQEVDVPFEPNARFLTLVATEADDTVEFDELCLLNPRVLVEAVDRRGESAVVPQAHRKNIANEESYESAQ